MFADRTRKLFASFLRYLQPRRAEPQSADTKGGAAEEAATNDGALQSPSENSSDAGTIVSQSSTDEYEQEPFITYQHKITEFCASVGLGSPSSVVRLKGGGFNRVIGIDFVGDDVKSYIIRIPRFRSNDDHSEELNNQISILSFIKHAKLPTPDVLAWDLTGNNPIGSECMIQNRVPGVPLNTVYQDMTMAEKMSFLHKIIPLIVKMQNIEFPAAGRLMAPEILPRTGCFSAGILEDAIVGGFWAGSGNGKIYKKVPVNPPTGTSLKHLFVSFFKGWMEYEDVKERPGTGDSGNDWPLPLYRTLIKIAEEMDHMGLMEPQIQPNVLFHWDFEPRNILVDKDENDEWQITAILDWDEALVVPRVISRKPPAWLWKFNLDPYDTNSGNIDWMENYQNDLGPDEQTLKELFDREMEMSLDGFAGDAYGPRRWVRRLWMFALSGISSSMDIDWYERFVKEWKAFASKGEDEES